MTNSDSVVDVERSLLAGVSTDVGWRLIERFSTLVRESGMADEHAGADYIVDELSRMGIDHEVHEPELFLSLPRAASVSWNGRECRAKPPAFAVPTPSEGVVAPGVYLPVPPMRDLGEIFDDKHAAGGGEPPVRGKIVVTNGYAMPSVVQRFERAGAVAQVYINPGANIHWGICTPIWGTPTSDNIEQKPRTPVVAVSQPDGDSLIDALERGATELTVRAALDEGWFPCKLPVATIKGAGAGAGADAGAGASDDFLLVHGHYDSWGIGIGDNAVGDATLLELARIFHEHRDRLQRSLMIAWWPGHSTGRYAGSTWFADNFAMQLRKHCIAAVNIDSPGCRGATAYEDVMWMAEADTLCRQSIQDATGQPAARRRPIRAGDYSFNQIGLTSFFMLLSNIPQEEREKHGLYPVGGCGGNIAWHTEDDVLDVANRDELEHDLRVYVTAIGRVLNSAILPFDHRLAVQEMDDALREYENEAGDLADLSVVRQELDGLRTSLAEFYEDVESDTVTQTNDSINRKITELSRILVPLNYARGRRFDHDPALPLGTIPMLSDVATLKSCRSHTPEQLPFLQAGIRRNANRIAAALYDAAMLVRHNP